MPGLVPSIHVLKRKLSQDVDGRGWPVDDTATPTAEAANRAAMDRMHGPMMQGIANADPDTFVLGMIPHHQDAIDMAETVMKFGKDARNQHLAREIIATQRREIAEMRDWLKRKNIPQP